MSLRLQLSVIADLLSHYAAVLRLSWQSRTRRPADFFNQQEAEFLPDALSLQEYPASASMRLTGRVLMAVVAFTLLWSFFGRVDIVVNASGKVIPSARTKTIASVEVASVRALHVTEGQAVHTGDVLIELDSSGSDAERDKAADSAIQARLQVARSEAMIAAVRNDRVAELAPVAQASLAQWQAAQAQLAWQYREFVSRRARLDDEIARLSITLPLAEQKAEDYRVLLHSHDVAQHDWLDKERLRLDLAGQLADMRGQRDVLVAQTLREAHAAITEAEKLLAASAQDELRASTRSQLLQLTSPVDGTVQQLTVHTVGGVVPAAQPLMQIVPRESFIEVEALLENKDAGFVRVGQKATVKIDAFDYTRYGTIDAVVSHIAQDSQQDEQAGLVYATRVVLDRSSLMVDGREETVTPGMTVRVEIKTGERRVISYVLSPLLQHQREALRER